MKALPIAILAMILAIASAVVQITRAEASTTINCINMGHITVCTNTVTGEQVIIQTPGR